MKAHCKDVIGATCDNVARLQDAPQTPEPPGYPIILKHVHVRVLIF